MKRAIVAGIVAFGLVLGAAAAKAETRDPKGEDGVSGGQVVADEVGARGGQFIEDEGVRGGQLCSDRGPCGPIFDVIDMD